MNHRERLRGGDAEDVECQIRAPVITAAAWSG
jgi:hypothetical protein